MTEHDKEDQTVDKGRRTFLKNSGIFATGILGGSVVGGLLFKDYNKQDTVIEDTKITNLHEARVFFDRQEDFDILSAATERIFPKDDNGPGAIELAVPNFIDKQLHGSWGTNAFDYMNGPFPQNKFVRQYEQMDVDQSKQGPNAGVLPDIPSARYQTRLNRGDMFLQGIKAIESESKKRFNNSFVDLDGDDQDTVLTAMEKGEVSIPGVSSITFFNLLVQMTIEGAYSDPVYGGNKNMLGWKMKEYPGPRAAYIGDIESEDFIKMDQESLKDYQA